MEQLQQGFSDPTQKDGKKISTRTSKPETELEPGVFGPLEPESEPLEKNQEPQLQPLGKKSGARAVAAKN